MENDSVFEKNPFLTQVFLVVFLFLVFVLLFEIGMRYTPFNAYIDRTFGFPAMHINDKKSGYDLAENFKGGQHTTVDIKYQVHSNSIGCFDYPVHNKESYSLMIGDSFTWGFSPLEKKWTTFVENSLNKRFYKCGVSGYGTKQALEKSKKIVNKKGYNPELIVYSYFWNDLNDDYLHPSSVVVDGSRVNTLKMFDYSTGLVEHYSNEEVMKQYKSFVNFGDPDYYNLNYLGKFKVWLKRNSILANLVNSYKKGSARNEVKTAGKVYGGKSKYHSLLPHMSTSEYPWLKKAWEDHLYNITKMKEYADSIGSNFVFVIIPEKSFVNSSEMNEVKKQNIMSSYQRLLQHLSKNNIQTINLLDHFVTESKPVNSQDTKKLYWPNDVHWNPDGERLAGKVITEFINSNELVK